MSTSAMHGITAVDGSERASSPGVPPRRAFHWRRGGADGAGGAGGAGGGAGCAAASAPSRGRDSSDVVARAARAVST
eukprot:2906532-Prymnesium_polylepis.3